MTFPLTKLCATYSLMRAHTDILHPHAARAHTPVRAHAQVTVLATNFAQVYTNWKRRNDKRPEARPEQAPPRRLAPAPNHSRDICSRPRKPAWESSRGMGIRCL